MVSHRPHDFEYGLNNWLPVIAHILPICDWWNLGHLLQSCIPKPGFSLVDAELEWRYQRTKFVDRQPQASGLMIICQKKKPHICKMKI